MHLMLLIIFYFFLPEAFKYQLRAYVYQARDIFAGDESGLSGMNFVQVNA